MEITVSSRNTEVSQALREAVEGKMGRLARKVHGLDRADVHFVEERNPRIAEPETCEVTLDGHGHHLRCKVSGADEFVALDRAAAKLEQQVEKAKTKRMRRRVAAHRSVDRRAATNGKSPRRLRDAG